MTLLQTDWMKCLITHNWLSRCTASTRGTSSPINPLQISQCSDASACCEVSRKQMVLCPRTKWLEQKRSRNGRMCLCSQSWQNGRTLTLNTWTPHTPQVSWHLRRWSSADADKTRSTCTINVIPKCYWRTNLANFKTHTQNKVLRCLRYL